jgi:hypothetical protein
MFMSVDSFNNLRLRASTVTHRTKVIKLTYA